VPAKLCLAVCVSLMLCGIVVSQLLSVENVEDDSENEYLDDHVVEEDEGEEDVEGVEKAQPGNNCTQTFGRCDKKKAKCNSFFSETNQKSL
jgi:hypothetical protein